MTSPSGTRVMVTGHRSVRGSCAAQVRLLLEEVLVKLRVRHPEGLVAVCGMAVGADAEFADAALAVGVPLVAAIPLETQSDPWPLEAQARYQKLFNQACEVVEVWKDPAYAAHTVGAKMHARDRWMVDHSNITVAVWDGRKTGGTYGAVRYAHQKGRKVLVLNPRDMSLCVVPPPDPRSRAKTPTYAIPYSVPTEQDGSVEQLFRLAEEVDMTRMALRAGLGLKVEYLEPDSG